MKTGKRFDNQVAVLSGVDPGDVVAASGQLKLDTGTIVSVIESGALRVPPQVPTN